MASINKVILIGNLGRDPEVRYTPGGAAVCNVTLATSRKWKNKDGSGDVEETEWHRVVFYDRLAEIAGEYLKKGRSVYVEGRLKKAGTLEAGTTAFPFETVFSVDRLPPDTSSKRLRLLDQLSLAERR